VSRRREPRRQVVRRASRTIRRSAERAVGQYAGPASIQTFRRSDIRRTGPIRASRRAVRRARLDRTIRRSDTSEPSAVRRAHLDPRHPPKRRERAVGQYAGPVSTERFAESNTRAIRRARLESNHPPKRRERAVGQYARPVSIRTIRRSATSEPSSKPLPRSRVRSGAQAAASGRRRYRTEPLRLFAVNPLTVGDLGRTVIWGFILV